jgi:hypothetical protein
VVTEKELVSGLSFGGNEYASGSSSGKQETEGFSREFCLQSA